MLLILFLLPVISLAAILLLSFSYFNSYTKMENYAEALEDNRVKKATQEIDEIIPLYIEMEGLQPCWIFQRYCLTSTMFRTYRQWKYKNLSDSFSFGLRKFMTAGEYIDFDQMAVLHYEEYARSYYRKILYDRMTTDLADLSTDASAEDMYRFLPDFQPFFTTESYQIDTFVNDVTNSVFEQLCDEGKFKKTKKIYLSANTNQKNIEKGFEIKIE